MVIVVLISSKMLAFGLVDLEGASFRSFLSRRSRRELCVKATSDIFDRLLAESDAQDDCLPTYSQVTKIDSSNIDRSSAWNPPPLGEYDAPLTISLRTEGGLFSENE